MDNVVLVTRLLASSITLTVSPTTAATGSPVSLTALVKPSEGSRTPTGTVEFENGGKVVGSATLNGAGQATFATSTLAAGSDSLTAVYLGDSIHATATSKAVAVNITTGSPAVTVSPTSLVFGNQAVSTASAAKLVTIKNSGTAAVSFSSIRLTGSLADDFTLSNACGPNLAAKASCTVSVIFKPVAAGDKVASLDIADTAGGSPQMVSLSGNGTSAGSTLAVSLSSTSLVFGSENVGSATAAKTVTVTNSGTATVTFSSIKLTGALADDFSLSSGCGSSLAPKASCSLSVIFKPVAAGAKSASVSIADNASGSPQSVSLSGTGASAGSTPAITLSPSSLAFGSEKVGSTSPAKTVTVTNSGTAAVTFSSINLTGTLADDFSLTNACGSNLGAKASCRVSVTFKPIAAGAKSASLSISDNASGSPQTASPSGSGT